LYIVILNSLDFNKFLLTGPGTPSIENGAHDTEKLLLNNSSK
jgi:hypothetical protein